MQSTLLRVRGTDTKSTNKQDVYLNSVFFITLFLRHISERCGQKNTSHKFCDIKYSSIPGILQSSNSQDSQIVHVIPNLEILRGIGHGLFQSPSKYSGLVCAENKFLFDFLSSSMILFVCFILLNEIVKYI